MSPDALGASKWCWVAPCFIVRKMRVDANFRERIRVNLLVESLSERWDKLRFNDLLVVGC